MKQNTRVLLLICLFFLASFAGRAQTGTTFWFAAPDLENAYNQDYPIFLVLSTLSQPSQVTISIPANSGFVPIIQSIGANSTASIDLTSYKSLIETPFGDNVWNTGLLIQATNPITAYYESQNIIDPEMFVLKGSNAFGNSFYIPFPNWGENGFGNSWTSFEIVATEDGTDITVIPTKDVYFGPGNTHPANVPFTRTLNAGQTYSVRAVTHFAADWPGGSYVTSNHPVAITMAVDNMNSSLWGTCSDLIGDQIIPVNLYGQDFIVPKGMLNTPPGDKAVIVASQNNTEIFLDGSLIPVATINAGGTYVATIPATSGATATFIHASNPITVLHYTGNACEYGAGIIPSVDCNLAGSNNIAFARSTDYDFVVMVITLNGNQNYFSMNGNTSVISGSSFLPVPGTAGTWVAAKIPLTAYVANGSLCRIQNSAGTFHAGVISGGTGNGCGYGYFTDFASCSSPQCIINAFAEPVLCHGGSTTVTVTAGGGVPPYTSTGTFTVTAGTHDFTITDATGCSAFTSLVITEPALLEASCSAGTIMCNGGTTTATVTASGGIEPYIGTGTFTVGPGSHDFTVTDFNGCTAVTQIVITDQNPCGLLDVSIDAQQTSDFCSSFPVLLTTNITSIPCPTDTGQLCFESPTIPDIVNAQINWTYWTYNQDNTVTIRTTFAKTFVDNTYGANAIGWPGGHTFGNLVGSDRLQLTLYDANDAVKMIFTMDYISQDATVPSGYRCLGVTGGEGSIQMGNVSDILSVTTSLDKNFNENGYVLTTNSPLTNNNYSINSFYPNWIYDVWYEVTIKLSALGQAGFGKPDLTYIHASPSKTGNNSEDVVPVPCEGEPTPDQYNYVWSTGETTSSIAVNSDGNYTVTVTIAQDCSEFASIEVTQATAASPLSDYVMLTRTHVQLKASTVHSGGVGVTDDYPENEKTGKLEIKDHSFVTEPGTFARSSHLIIDNNSQVAVPDYTTAQIKFPKFEGMPYHGSTSINVPQGHTMILTDTLYKEVKIGKNATAIFSQAVVNIEKGIKMENGSLLKFQQTCTKVRSNNQFELGENVTINPDGYAVTFYISKDMKVKAGANVTGIFYLGDVSHQNDTAYHHLHIEDSKVSRPALFTGLFLAECIHSGKNTNWYAGNFCSFSCPVISLKELQVADELPENASEMIVNNYPNPFNDKTTIDFTLSWPDKVTIGIYDNQGQLIKVIFENEVEGGIEYTTEISLDQLPAGIYFYKIFTSRQIYVGKLMLIE